MSSDYDCLVITNSLNRFGLRVIHVLTAERFDAMELAVQQVPGESVGSLRVAQWKDTVGMWHTAISWKAREKIDIFRSKEDPSPIPGVMWWLGESPAIELENAIKKYKDIFGKMPGLILVHELAGLNGRTKESMVVNFVPDGFAMLCEIMPEQKEVPARSVTVEDVPAQSATGGSDFAGSQPGAHAPGFEGGDNA